MLKTSIHSFSIFRLTFSKVKAAFFRRKIFKWSYYFFLFVCAVALLAPLLANDKPLYCKLHDQIFFPAFSFTEKIQITSKEGEPLIIEFSSADWKRMSYDQVIWAPCAWSPTSFDFDNADFISPGGDQIFRDATGNLINMPLQFRHWLGTGKKGDDVLSGLIHGSRISLVIGVASMLVAGIIGIFLGALAGFYQDDRLQISRGQWLGLFLGIIPAWFYGFRIGWHSLTESLSQSAPKFFIHLLFCCMVFVIILMVFYRIGKLFSRISWFQKKVNLPVDSLISRSIEVINSIPRLILIISISMIAKPSILNLILIMGFTMWTEIARLTRAEFLKNTALDYTQAAFALGLPNFRIVFYHILPNSIAPAIVAISFGVAGAILVESSLSFLGIGVPGDTVTWGSLLSAARENFNAWWLVIFPGLAIFLMVTVYNILGEAIREYLNPRLKK